MPLRRALPALLAIAAVMAACSGDDDPPPAATPTSTATSPTVEATSTTTVSPTASPTFEATSTPEATATTPAAFGPIATEAILGGRAFERPIELIANAATGEFWVADQRGDIRAFTPDGDEIRAVLDIRDRVRRSGNEEGLLSVTLDPAFGANGHLWVYYSVAPGVRRTRLARFEVSGGVADPASELVVLEVTQPYGNHNGGTIRFGPDGMLYLSLGDGGSGGDPLGNAQNLETLLGSVLRLDVRDASEERPYVIPADNPFVDDPAARDEIWAYGLRNPWRMAFDGATGALWLGDVGQSAAEEIDIIERGANYGWNRFESFACFNRDAGCDRTGLTMPVASYSHPDFGRGVCSVTGGVVYRANRVPQIANAYLFGDFCSGELWAIAADAPGDAEVIAEGFGGLVSFAFDADGEVLLLRFNEPILRIVSP